MQSVMCVEILKLSKSPLNLRHQEITYSRSHCSESYSINIFGKPLGARNLLKQNNPTSVNARVI